MENELFLNFHFLPCWRLARRRLKFYVMLVTIQFASGNVQRLTISVTNKLPSMTAMRFVWMVFTSMKTLNGYWAIQICYCNGNIYLRFPC